SLVVDSLADEADGNLTPGNVSLRDAVLLTNKVPGLDTITFSPALNGQKITLTLGEIPITGDLSIVGPGAGQLTVDANNASRIFNIADGTTAAINVSISGLTLTNGSGTSGGAIIMDPENVTLSNMTFTGNNASASGGVLCFSTSGGNV